VPENCNSSIDCKFVYKYLKIENNTKFELAAKLSNSDSAWLAIGKLEEKSYPS
jgi:hypothetical protein